MDSGHYSDFKFDVIVENDRGITQVFPIVMTKCNNQYVLNLICNQETDNESVHLAADDKIPLAIIEKISVKDDDECVCM